MGRKQFKQIEILGRKIKEWENPTLGREISSNKFWGEKLRNRKIPLWGEGKEDSDDGETIRMLDCFA